MAHDSEALRFAMKGNEDAEAIGKALLRLKRDNPNRSMSTLADLYFAAQANQIDSFILKWGTGNNGVGH